MHATLLVEVLLLAHMDSVDVVVEGTVGVGVLGLVGEEVAGTVFLGFAVFEFPDCVEVELQALQIQLVN